MKSMQVPTLMELKNSIPRVCFESSTKLSMYYVLRSLALAMFNGVIFHQVLKRMQAASVVFTITVCAVYWFLQGLIFWGFFTIGHDCGHGSFSRHASVNFVVGCLMHSLILTPFESWKLSHRYHHKNTGNMDKDEIFYPHRASENNAHARWSVYLVGLAWFLYLKLGFPPRNMDHFNVNEPLFARRVGYVGISIATWFAVFGASIVMSLRFGLMNVAMYYYVPIFVFATFLVVVTFLHHNDEETVWYDNKEWSYVKGNLSSVDRSYGPFVNNLSHNIGTHQVHHLFPIIPHYNLKQATEAFQKAYPHLKRECNEPILKSFFKTAKQYVKYGVADDNAATFSFKSQANALNKKLL